MDPEVQQPRASLIGGNSFRHYWCLNATLACPPVVPFTAASCRSGHPSGSRALVLLVSPPQSALQGPLPPWHQHR
ncbi:hypothetical protein E2C01_046873 [Portunus trituberculatus]|uniref:Uncharacterized protein n=1 Tax=Portunus trituberculatus TaxID=210409 RepID=A0A5B7FYW9_PORTR|nr:hypothetical protein [Portunus trituberculatus]